MANDPKDTIYIDVDDEITGIIDKVTASDKKLVALVLPKRASVFQSIVNMKLLKRKSDEVGKKIVLVSTDSDLLPLAGAVGVHVAKTLASAPEIPPAPAMSNDALIADEGESLTLPDEDPETKDDQTGPVPMPPTKTPANSKDLEDTIELDNSALAAGAAAEAADKSPLDKGKSKLQKGLKVPNFERFRILIGLGALGLIALIVLLILMFSVWPKALVEIKTNAQNVAASVNFNMNTSSSSFDLATATIPAKQVTENKTYTATTNATGQQNNGQTASGSVSMTAVVCPSDSNYPFASDVPAGIGISQNNLTYITQSDTSFPLSGNGDKNTKCITYNQSGSTKINAQKAGTAYNTSSNNTTFKVSNQPDAVTATGGASGGTDNIVTVVSQTDINTATGKIVTNNNGAVKHF